MENSLLAKSDRRIETGFVGFFDILGYGSFLESGISENTFRVMDILDTLPNGVQAAALKEHWNDHFFERLRPDLDRMHQQVVSDSILFASPYHEGSDRAFQAATFLVIANVLERVMFEKGLPLRGAIAFGDFVFGTRAFAGKPIIDAYKLAASLDLAACAVHESAEREFESLCRMNPQYEDFLGNEKSLHRLRYRAPVSKSSAEVELSLLNLTWPTLEGHPPLETLTDLRQYVHEQFLAHGKKISLDAVSKVENTERFLRFLQSHYRRQKGV